jgi:hypothetical protein
MNAPRRELAELMHTLGAERANLQTTAIYVQVAGVKRVEAIDRLDPFG